mmetsp:Transcript_16061/g.39575  ORF Transcript_16061/g.39575 Transcript_16061/m.39575 type:complete len:227 (-) Transcript_16061:208-888(-)
MLRGSCHHAAFSPSTTPFWPDCTFGSSFWTSFIVRQAVRQQVRDSIHAAANPKRMRLMSIVVISRPTNLVNMKPTPSTNTFATAISHPLRTFMISSLSSFPVSAFISSMDSIPDIEPLPSISCIEPFLSISCISADSLVSFPSSTELSRDTTRIPDNVRTIPKSINGTRYSSRKILPSTAPKRGLSESTSMTRRAPRSCRARSQTKSPNTIPMMEEMISTPTLKGA